MLNFKCLIKRRAPRGAPQLKIQNSKFKIAAVFLAALLAGCGKEPVYQQQSYVFGTMVEVTLYGEKEDRAKQLEAHVLADFDKMHNTLHAWKPSTLSRMNEVFANSPAKAELPPDVAPILQDAAQLSAQSGGLFNPSIGHLIQLWGFQNDEFKPVQPDPQEIARWVKANPQMSDIVIEGKRYYSKNPAVKLDLGGYGKGYALDVAADYLRSQGAKNALINIGGNLMALGQHGGRPWQVGIQHPRKPGPIASLELHDGEAIGTSGDYQRYFMQDGKRYCHIIDPRTGYPVQRVEAVTVLIPPGKHAGVLSDVASKPPFIAGVSGWREAVRRMGVEEAMLIDDKGEIYITSAMRKRLKFLENDLVIHEVP